MSGYIDPRMLRGYLANIDKILKEVRTNIFEARTLVINKQGERELRNAVDKAQEGVLELVGELDALEESVKRYINDG